MFICHCQCFPHVLPFGTGYTCGTALVLTPPVFFPAAVFTHFCHWFWFLLLLVSLSEIGILAAAVGGACGVILIILGIVVAVRLFRRKKMDKNVKMRAEVYSRNVLWGQERSICAYCQYWRNVLSFPFILTLMSVIFTCFYNFYSY